MRGRAPTTPVSFVMEAAQLVTYDLSIDQG